MFLLGTMIVRGFIWYHTFSAQLPSGVRKAMRAWIEETNTGSIVVPARRFSFYHFSKCTLSRILDKVLRPEVRPEVHNLPRAQRHEHSHGANSKPLDTLVCALVGISQPDLTTPQVVQLSNNLGSDLADSLELRLHGLQLLAGLNGIPVLCVCANVDVELDVAVGVGDCVACGQDVLEADVESAVLVGVEGVS